MKASIKPETIDQYIAALDPSLKAKAEEMRSIIHKAAPEAEECISYGMPAFKMKKVLVYFAVWKEHIGFYPTGSGTAAFASDLEKYEVSKGTVRFPLNKPLPKTLITKMVKYRIGEVQSKPKKK
ncbi:MAG: DUF1801 domain-containing protein [Chitinophagales bacterium]